MDSITGPWPQEIQDKIEELAKRFHLNIIYLPDGRIGEINILTDYYVIPLFLMARFAECEIEKEALKKELENHKCVQSVKEEEKSQPALQQE